TINCCYGLPPIRRCVGTIDLTYCGYCTTHCNFSHEISVARTTPTTAPTNVVNDETKAEEAFPRALQSIERCLRISRRARSNCLARLPCWAGHRVPNRSCR